MINKLPITINYGKPVSFNSSTYQFTYDHPVLDIGDSYLCLKDDVVAWLESSIAKGDWTFDHDGENYCLWFVKTEDLVLFKVTWL